MWGGVTGLPLKRLGTAAKEERDYEIAKFEEF
jgi:hypothetical protein